MSLTNVKAEFLEHTKNLEVKCALLNLEILCMIPAMVDKNCLGLSGIRMVVGVIARNMMVRSGGSIKLVLRFQRSYYELR
jgi:hypothetical protein